MHGPQSGFRGSKGNLKHLGKSWQKGKGIQRANRFSQRFGKGQIGVAGCIPVFLEVDLNAPNYVSNTKLTGLIVWLPFGVSREARRDARSKVGPLVGL